MMAPHVDYSEAFLESPYRRFRSDPQDLRLLFAVADSGNSELFTLVCNLCSACRFCITIPFFLAGSAVNTDSDETCGG